MEANHRAIPEAYDALILKGLTEAFASRPHTMSIHPAMVPPPKTTVQDKKINAAGLCNKSCESNADVTSANTPLPSSKGQLKSNENIDYHLLVNKRQFKKTCNTHQRVHGKTTGCPHSNYPTLELHHRLSNRPCLQQQLHR